MRALRSSRTDLLCSFHVNFPSCVDSNDGLSVCHWERSILSKWKNEIPYLIRHTWAGCLNAVVGLGSIFLLMHFGMSPTLANLVGFTIGFVVAFTTAKSYVFQSSGRTRSELLKYLVAFVVAFTVNQAVLYICLMYFWLNSEFAQMAAIGSYVMTSYVLSRMFVFSNRQNINHQHHG